MAAGCELFERATRTYAKHTRRSWAELMNDDDLKQYCDIRGKALGSVGVVQGPDGDLKRQRLEMREWSTETSGLVPLLRHPNFPACSSASSWSRGTHSGTWCSCSSSSSRPA